MELTPQEIEFARIISCPISFAKYFFEWEARWYQKEMLLDKSLRKVSRCGRRVGKCKYENSEIITELGPVKVKDLYSMKDRPKILTFDTYDQSIKLTPKYEVISNGPKPVYKLTTKTGRTNYATGNHPYLTIDENGNLNWLEIDNMLPGDRIAVPKTYEGLIKGKSVSTELLRSLGYLIGNEGNKVRLTKLDENMILDIKNILNDYNYSLKKDVEDDSYFVVWKEPNESNEEKSAKGIIMGADKRGISSFLSAYWDCNGWINYQEDAYDSPMIEIGACMPSHQLAKDIQHLLLRLGICSILEEKDESKKSWQVTIYDKDNIVKFAKEIELRPEKQEDLKKALKVLGNKNYSNSKHLDTIPKEILTYVKKRQTQLGIPNIQACEDLNRANLLEYGNGIQDSYLQKLATNDIMWDEVVSIEYIGEHETYDLTVLETHTFIADDIISHNTDVICVHMMWFAYTHENAVLLVAAPYENQIDLIFTRLREFIKKSPDIGASVVANRRHPNYLEFGNGSRIQGFTAGRLVPVYHELLEVPKVA